MNQFIKVNSIVFVLSASMIVGGCSSEHDKKVKEAKTHVATSSGIEVVTNTNANEIKVAKKKSGVSKDKAYYMDYGVKSAYPEDANPANKDASVRMKPRTSMDANLHVRSPYEQVTIAMMVNKLSKKFIVKCSACHSDYANGIIGPSLLGKSSDYIYKKLIAFKKDKTLNVLMSGLVSQMSDTEIREMADEVYKFNLKIRKMKDQ